VHIFVFLVAGIASWFNIDTGLYGSNALVCASNMVVPGTRIYVENVDTHKTSPCVVIGTGPFVPGRILDVSPAVRDRLGMDGLASVVVYRSIGVAGRCHRAPPPLTCRQPPPAPCILDLPTHALLVCK